MSFEDKIRKVVPYVPGEQPKQKNIIKLNTNECPYPPAQGVQEKLKNFRYEDLRLYPDPDASDITKALANYYKVDEDNIFVGVGSDDVISMAFMTFFNSKSPILFPNITYSFYEVWADLHKVPYKKIPLTDDFRIKKEDYFVENGGIIFPNPNAPTGIYEDLDMIEEIVAKNSDVVVIIDEAYIDFGGTSALPLIEKYDNLLVVQTFSKSRAMAGMRIGFAFGSKKLIGYLKDVKFSFNSYTMNRPSIECAKASIEDDVYFKDTCKKIIKTRQNTEDSLKNLGFTFPKSEANFIFAKHDKIKAKVLLDELKKRGIFVRYFDKDRIDNYLRITIGTDDEMKALIKAFEEIIKEN